MASSCYRDQKGPAVNDDPIAVPIAERRVGPRDSGSRQQRSQLSCGPECHHVSCVWL